MEEYPMTKEQEEEMRQRARRAIGNNNTYSTTLITIILGGFVFKNGRLSDSVSWQTRWRIANEEITSFNSRNIEK